ncbi:MAG TPA: SpoIIE family protein phosphatase, partial [Bacteroidales bacterium]|nr:SpoIIE family protein phosphatase [Bacteroidales bacterium]
ENDYSVVNASNGLEACQAVLKEIPDLILIDIEMPVMNGIEAIGQIKHDDRYKHIPIIVMSSTRQFQEAFIAGGDDFLLKPFNAYELLMRIQLNLKLAEKGKEIQKQHELLNLQKKEAIEQRDIIYKQKTDLMDDLYYARHVQNAISPSADDLNELFEDHFIYNRPKFIVSGDFHWVARKSNQTIIAVGDCTGHGVSGALMTIAGVAFLNEIVSENHVMSAEEMLNKLRDKVILFLKQKGDVGETSNGMDISLCIYDAAKGNLQFAGANGSLYLVKKGSNLEVIKGDRMPIGFFFDHYHSFTKSEIEIAKGDSIYLFTDGYPDQFGGPLGKKFRYQQFREMFEKASALPSMGEQHELVKDTMDQWIGDHEQIDDMLIVGIRF